MFEATNIKLIFYIMNLQISDILYLSLKTTVFSRLNNSPFEMKFFLLPAETDFWRFANKSNIFTKSKSR